MTLSQKNKLSIGEIITVLSSELPTKYRISKYIEVTFLGGVSNSPNNLTVKIQTIDDEIFVINIKYIR